MLTLHNFKQPFSETVPTNTVHAFSQTQLYHQFLHGFHWQPTVFISQHNENLLIKACIEDVLKSFDIYTDLHISKDLI